jgi:hypothetical protein
MHGGFDARCYRSATVIACSCGLSGIRLPAPAWLRHVADEDNVVAVMPVLVAALEMRDCADQDRRPAFRDNMVDLGEFVLVRARELVRQLDL